MENLTTKDIIDFESEVYGYSTEKYSFIVGTVPPYWESPEFEGSVNFKIKDSKSKILFSRIAFGGSTEFILTNFKVIKDFLEGKNAIVLFDNESDDQVKIKRKGDDLELLPLHRTR